MSGKKEGVQESPRERAMTQLALNQLDDYKKRWLPVQQNLSKGIVKMGADGSFEREQATGVAANENEARFSPARAAIEAQLSNQGAAGSSKQKLAITGMGEDQATSKGLGMQAADQQIDDAYVQGLSSVMALGQGEKATAIGGQARVAGMAGRQAANDAEISLQTRMGNAQLAGQAVGTGFGLFGNRKAPRPYGGEVGFDENADGSRINNPSAFVG